MDDALRDLGGQLVVLSARLIREVRRANADHPTHVRVLSMLDEYGPSTVSALAQADGCTQPSMTALVNALVERGWVTREPHPDDARSSLITTTADGSDALQRFREHNAQGWPSGSRAVAAPPRTSPPPSPSSPTCCGPAERCPSSPLSPTHPLEEAPSC